MNREALCEKRLDRAEDCLEEVRILLNAGKIYGANDRIYMGILYAIKAVQALDGEEYKRHRQVIGNFNRKYVKTGIFRQSLGRWIVKARNISNNEDYEVNRDETIELLEIAAHIVSTAKVYCESRTRNNE